jgi:FixJ family two-component response regulator
MNGDLGQSAPHIKLLLVDDSVEDRTIFKRFLSQDKERRYEFRDAETVDEAFRLIQKERPDCILLDYDMPGISGNDLIESLIAQYGKNQLPVVMLSGSGNIEVAVEAMRLGAQDFLVKHSAVPADLMRAVNNAIDKVKLHRDKELASEKMQVSEERYRLLFDNTPLPAIVFDRETLAIFAVNGYAVRHYGYSGDEFMRMTLNELDAFEGASEEIVVSEFCNEKVLF